MSWESDISPKILARGKLYYKQGRVIDLKLQRNIWVAKVQGSRVYTVKVMVNDEREEFSVTCTCPYWDGDGCKHLVATLYAIEKQKAGGTSKNQPSKPKFITPFQQKEGYSYFNLAHMTRQLKFLSSDWENAQKLVENEQIEHAVFVTEYPKYAISPQLCGRYIATYFKPYPVTVRIGFTQDVITDAKCECERCNHIYNQYYSNSSKYSSLCVHEMAALILMDTYIREHNPGDATDKNGDQMLQSIRKQLSVQKPALPQATPQTAFLEPRAEYSHQTGLTLSFRVGDTRGYMVRNLTDLVSCVEDRQVYALGKSGGLDFKNCVFAEKSQEYFDMIRQGVAQGKREQARLEANDVNHPTQALVKAKLPLQGRLLDQFYTMAQGEKIPFANENADLPGNAILAVQEGAPRIPLFIYPNTDEQGVFQGVHVNGAMPVLLDGLDHCYFVEGSALYRLAPEKVPILNSLSLASVSGRLSFKVGRNNLTDFYHTVLPALGDMVEVTEESPEVIERFLPPTAEITYYLDAENDDVTCQIAAKYGNAVYQVTDLLEKQIQNVSYRDISCERRALDCAQLYFMPSATEKNVLTCDGDEDRIYQLLDHGLRQLMEYGQVHCTDRFNRLKVHRTAKIKMGVSVEDGLMDLTVTSDDLSYEDLLALLFSYKRKKKYHRLKNGDFLRLENTGLQELAELMESMHLSPKEFARGKMHIPLYRSLYLDKKLEDIEAVTADRDKAFKQLMKDFKTVEDSDFEVPEKLRSVLRGYQTYGYRWLRTLIQYGFGGILADEMGLGKTLQVISALYALKLEGQGGPSLVVAPASLVYNWLAEFARFAPDMQVRTLTGTKAERRLLLQSYQKWDVLITSYDLLKRDIDLYDGLVFHCQILDEAQYIKNHGTTAAKSVKVVAARHRLAMTGTPIENRLSELWSIFDYLMPGFLYPYESFRKELELPITKNRDADKSARLRQMVQPFILRRLKKDVLKDLPDKMEEVRYLQMEKKQQQVYDGQVVRMKNLVSGQTEQEFRTGKLEILAELTRIRQICCDPSLLLENYDGESAKRQGCMELIQSAISGEHRMLVFSQFTSMLELLEQDLNAQGIAYYTITGATPKQERIRLVNAFNSDNTPVFLISLKAGGVGLNLTGADVVIHYDPWWNLAVQNQATDRAHRIGQTKVVSVYKLITKGTIEEKILHLQESKKDLADEILKGESGGLMSMSREELLQLFDAP